jgi:hypothetical protein
VIGCYVVGLEYRGPLSLLSNTKVSNTLSNTKLLPTPQQ